MSILFDRLFTAIAFSHFFVDILNGQRGVLLAYLSVPLALSNTTVGLVSSIYMISAALVQPFSGWLTDRVGPRWLVSGGVLWMGAFFVLALLIPGKVALILLVIASLGSGMFHPAGSMQSTLLGRTRFSGREGTTASIFFFVGQSGYALGPLLGGPLLALWGPPGLVLIVALCLPVSVYGNWQLRYPIRPPEITLNKPSMLQSSWTSLKGQGRVVTALLLVATGQSWIQQNLQTFVPKYLNDLGQGPGVYGIMAALYMFGSAIGNVIGGYTGDRIGQRTVILTGMALLGAPLWVITMIGYSPWLFLMIPLAGIFSGAAYTAIFTTSQRLIPGATGLAAGLALSFMFSSGSIGVLLSGWVADLAGFTPVFTMSAILALLSCILAWGLKPDRPVEKSETRLVES
ncbi:MAG: MFS transporter [Anaerolineaceae bacterium]|nr:MFS transporter [Anaerolineaceae bacterium]